MRRKTDQPVGRKTLTELAYERIKEDILSGVLKPGESITTTQIANGLQVSSMPVRGALARLGTDGLVVILPQRGVFVAKITPDELRENYDVRSLLEGFSAKLACSHIDRNVDTLRQLLAEMRQTATTNGKRWSRANSQFHETIIQCSQNETLIRILTDLRQQSLRSRIVSWRVPGHMLRREAEHQRIVDALAVKNGRLAEKAMADHVLAAGRELLDYTRNASGP